MKRMPIAIIAVVLVGCGGSTPSAPSGPPPSSPSGPPPQPSVGLTGYVRETAPTETVPVANARVEVVDTSSGSLTGNFVLTDSSGFYRFPGLSGSVSFRASKDGYEGDPRRFHLAQIQSGDFTIMPISRKPARESISIGETRTGSVGAADATCGGMFFRLPCKRFVLTVGGPETLRVRLTWSTRHDVDLELWRGDALVKASLTCQSCGVGTSEEAFDVDISSGEYELRATYFLVNDGASAPFELIVTRSN